MSNEIYVKQYIETRLFEKRSKVIALISRTQKIRLDKLEYVNYGDKNDRKKDK